MHPLRNAPLLAVLLLLVPTATAGAAAVAPHAPEARIGPVDCTAGGAVVTMRNPSSAPARFTVRRGARVVATRIIAAGSVGTHVVPITDGGSARVSASSGHGSASAVLHGTCDRQNVASGGSKPVPAPSSSVVEEVARPVIASNRTMTVDGPVPAQRKLGAQRSLPDESRFDVPVLGLALVSLAVVLAGLVASAPLRRRIRRVTDRRRAV